MEPTKQKEIGVRLKKLREHSKLSQSELANIISPRVEIVMEYDAGKQTISQLERGKRGLTIEIASAYADIFDVSLDYIYGRSEDWKPEYKDIKTQLGFSDGTISQLEHIKNNDNVTVSVLDFLLNPINSTSFLEFLLALREHRTTHIMEKDNIPYIKAEMDKFYEGKDMSNDYKYKATIEKGYNDAMYVSLFKISEISKKIANEYVTRITETTNNK